MPSHASYLPTVSFKTSKGLRAHFQIIFLVLSVILAACSNPQTVKKQKYFSEGRVIYQNHCIGCHQENGEGFTGLIPPLTDTAWLSENRRELPCIIRNGMEGEITINGREYNQPMPANPGLSDMEIAEVLTYITNTFGNRQEIFTTEEVQNSLHDCKD